MATNFDVIYTRALSIFKDPVLSRLQSTNLQVFCRIMYTYLQTAVTLYNPNKYTHDRLLNQTSPQYNAQEFEGDGTATDFVLTSAPLPDFENVVFLVKINDVEISDSDYLYVKSINTVAFNEAPEENSKIEITWYNIGSFNNELYPEDITLLSLALCWAWAIQTSNNSLDINRNLNDTDFKTYSEANTIREKSRWVKMYEEMFARELSKADWRPTFRR